MRLRPYPKLKPTLWDGLVVLAVAALAAAAALQTAREGGSAEALAAVVTADGEVVERFSLADAGRRERTVRSGGYTLFVVSEAGEVWVESADCPTQDCVRTGRIARSGQSIVCLPARVIVQLEGGTADGGVDAVIG